VNVPTDRQTWAAVVINHNSSAFLDSCLRALVANRLPPAEVMVVDNASTDDSMRELAAWPQVVVEQSTTNLGFAGGADRGIALTEAPIVLVLNPDVELDPDFGEHLIHLFDASPRLGVAGAKLRYPDSDLLQHAGGILHWPLLTTIHRGYREKDEPKWNEPADVDYVTGGAMVLRRTAINQIGGFDERFWPVYFEDVDICLRLRDAGWQVRYQPELTAVHVESVTLGQSLEYYRLFHRNRLRLALKRLSRDVWWSKFVPAEIQRLRGELSAVSNADWPLTSGASAIEEMSRTGILPRRSDDVLFNGEPLAAMIAAMDEIRERREVVLPAEEPGGSGLRAGIVRRLFGRQQAFNDAVVRALEAQDRVNRELSAQVLLTLLDFGWRAARRDTP
jgi:GT2 family glycosyltransferase